ncbi:hypothetical protein E0J20_09335 [Rhizobium leguminosarum bv. viciae]|nr:hypothetical protein E0J20_09335 [Rhizobium leguminosarum bv. viciae]
MAAIYDGLEFKTPLAAQWAAFFDLAGWKWNVNPRPVGNWSPDFRVSFPCGHSECRGSHTLLVSVLPVSRIEDFKGRPALSFPYGGLEGKHISADASAAFGGSPRVTTWEMTHGSGGGVEDVTNWVGNADALWTKAGTLVSQS